MPAPRPSTAGPDLHRRAAPLPHSGPPGRGVLSHRKATRDGVWPFADAEALGCWPRGIRWLAGIAAVVLALAIVWALFVPAADWLAHHDVGSATGPLLQTARDAARGRLLTLGAGLFAAGALVFTARNLRACPAKGR